MHWIHRHPVETVNFGLLNIVNSLHKGVTSMYLSPFAYLTIIPHNKNQVNRLPQVIRLCSRFCSVWMPPVDARSRLAHSAPYLSRCSPATWLQYSSRYVALLSGVCLPICILFVPRIFCPERETSNSTASSSPNQDGARRGISTLSFSDCTQSICTWYSGGPGTKEAISTRIVLEKHSSNHSE